MLSTELEHKVAPYEEIGEKMQRVVQTALDGDLCRLDTEELGEAVDIIKDMAEAKCKCYEAAYYETVIKAMERGERNGYEDSERPGYNNWRFQNGRFAPTGSGNYTGYTDTWSADVDLSRYGYPGDNSSNNMGSVNGQNTNGTNNRRGYTMTNSEMESIAEDVMGKNREFGRGIDYRNYSKSRRYYTETHDAKHKTAMDEHTKKHLLDTCETIREMYANADPEMKRRIKDDISKLMGDLM